MGELFAYILISNSNHKKYVTLHKVLTTQYSLVNDQFPKTVRDLTYIVSMHMHNGKHHDPQQGIITILNDQKMIPNQQSAETKSLVFPNWRANTDTAADLNTTRSLTVPNQIKPNVIIE